MSKIILSSCDFRNAESAKNIYDNLPLPISDCRVLYFPNEKATEAAIKSDKFRNRLLEFGFAKSNIYIFNYFFPSDFDCNNDIDVIYISGGNTFGTLKRIRESNADKIICDYVLKVQPISVEAREHILLLVLLSMLQNMILKLLG